MEVRRLTKQEALTFMGVSSSTLERRIKSGEVQVEREKQGGRVKVWVLPDDDSQGDNPNGNHPGSQQVTDDNQVAILKVQVENALALAEYRAGLLTQAGRREQLLLDQLAASQKNLEAVTHALNPGPAPVERPRRRWWPWWSRS